jgi:hypothetical protein
MKGVCLRFHMHKDLQHHHILAYEWLLALIQSEKLPLFYLMTPVEYGILNGETHG